MQKNSNRHTGERGKYGCSVKSHFIHQFIRVMNQFQVFEEKFSEPVSSCFCVASHAARRCDASLLVSPLPLPLPSWLLRNGAVRCVKETVDVYLAVFGYTDSGRLDCPQIFFCSLKLHFETLSRACMVLGWYSPSSFFVCLKHLASNYGPNKQGKD